jgi:hypothetical protein
MLRTKYVPLYVAVVVTGIVMALLFLHPDQVLGLSVAVDPPQNERNSLAGFKLAEPVVITARINLEGELENIASAALDITQISGGLGFDAVADVDLPVSEVSGQVVALPQGTLVVDVVFADITAVKPVDGSAYGYQGGGVSGGVITYTLTYTPPSIQGDYEAAVSVTTDQQVVSNTTGFTILGALSTQALATLYPASEEGAALPGDLVVLQLSVPDTNAADIVSAKVSGNILSGQASAQADTSRTMFSRSEFHPAILEKWDVSPDADFLLPLRINPEEQARVTVFLVSIETEDIAGQTNSLSGAGASAQVRLTDGRSSFNVYLMPGFTFVTPPLQCVGADCTGNLEHDIAQMLATQTVSRDKLNPAFLAEIPDVGDVPLSKVVESIFAWDAVDDSFPVYTTSPSADDLFSMKVGNGYIVKTATVNGVGPFKVFTGDSPQFDSDTEVPVPIKLTFSGNVLVDPELELPTYQVEPVWNLVGAHSERDTSVGVFLSNVTFRERKWVSLIAFNNILDIALDGNGDVRRLDSGEPELLLVTRFETLLGPGFSSLPAGDTVSAGSGMWLLMCDGPVLDCGGDLAPVLE